MQYILLAILSRLSQFPSPQLEQIDYVDMPMNKQSINLFF